MDFLAMLERELLFVEQFYDRTAEPFATMMRKIKAGEEPFVPAFGEGDGQPPFTDEWLDADKIVSTLGSCALGLVENALHKYLRKFAMNELGEHRNKEFSQLFKFKGDGWFAKYEVFLQERGFEWTKSPVQRDRLEQINLTRNDINHDTGFDIPPTRTKEHIRKHPVPMFADENEMLMLAGSDELPIYIKVARDNLMAAIEDVRHFCGFVETRRTVW